MKIEEAQHLFYELLDKWTDNHIATVELRSKMIEAFANVAKGSIRNPSLEIIDMLEAAEESEKRLKERIDELMRSIKWV